MKLNEILGIEFPIIQGGMANIATGEFAAACSNAGALGLIGSGGMNADSLRENIRRCKALTDKPFGVNLMLMNPAVDEMAKVVIEEGVKVVTTWTPSSTTTLAKSSMWGFISIRLTPKGLSVAARAVWISLRRESASIPPEPIRPRAPALETAAAKAPVATLAMPP